MNGLLAQEPVVRMGAFAGIFVLMALWEVLAPRRDRSVGRGYRWLNNLAVVAVDAALVRVLFPAVAVGTALFVESQGWRLLPLLDIPYWLTLSNFGFNLPWCDRLFGTNRAQPRDGHTAMTIGINLFRDPRELRLDRVLWQPFRSPTPNYSINARQEDDRSS